MTCINHCLYNVNMTSISYIKLTVCVCVFVKSS